MTVGAGGQVLGSIAMADVEPLRALHYDLGVTGGLGPVVSPPYDVIDPAQRAELAARSPRTTRRPSGRSCRTTPRRTGGA